MTGMQIIEPYYLQLLHSDNQNYFIHETPTTTNNITSNYFIQTTRIDSCMRRNRHFTTNITSNYSIQTTRINSYMQHNRHLSTNITSKYSIQPEFIHATKQTLHQKHNQQLFHSNNMQYNQHFITNITSNYSIQTTRFNSYMQHNKHFTTNTRNYSIPTA